MREAPTQPLKEDIALLQYQALVLDKGNEDVSGSDP